MSGASLWRRDKTPPSIPKKKENNIFFSLIYKHRRPPSSQRSQWMSMNLSMSTEKAATVAHPKHMALGPP